MLRKSEVFSDLHGGTGVIDFWDHRRMYILNFIPVDIDTASYDEKHPHKILSQNEQRKKGKYLEAYHQRQCDFSPSVFLVD